MNEAALWSIVINDSKLISFKYNFLLAFSCLELQGLKYLSLLLTLNLFTEITIQIIHTRKYLQNQKTNGTVGIGHRLDR